MPALATLAQSWGTGAYVALDGGAVLVGEANDVASSLVAAEKVAERLPMLGRDWDFGFGFGGSVGVGYDFGLVRLDGAITYHSTGISINRDGQDRGEDNEDRFSVLAATANTWLDLDTGTAWTLYFGGGFGAANPTINLVDVKIEELAEEPDYDFSTWSLAFQAGAGVGYHVADFLVIDLTYRLLGAIDPKLVKSGSLDDEAFEWPLEPGTLLTHRIGLSLRVIFL